MVLFSHWSFVPGVFQFCFFVILERNMKHGIFFHPWQFLTVMWFRRIGAATLPPTHRRFANSCRSPGARPFSGPGMGILLQVWSLMPTPAQQAGLNNRIESVTHGYCQISIDKQLTIDWNSMDFLFASASTVFSMNAGWWEKMLNIYIYIT